MPARPEHVLLAAEVVSPGSETTYRIVKLDQYASADIPLYWRANRPSPADSPSPRGAPAPFLTWPELQRVPRLSDGNH
jgi:hypothetical protein